MGDESELEGHSEEADQGQEDPVAARELHPGEGVGGKGGQGDRDDRGRDRDHEAVEEALTEIARRKHLTVVVQRELEWRRQGGPPKFFECKIGLSLIGERQ